MAHDVRTNRACRDVLRNHLHECRTYAKAKVHDAIRFEREAVCKEEGARLRYLKGYRSDVDEVLGVEERTERCACRDPALNSIKEILACAPDNESDIVPIEMPVVENVPKYDAWVPVRTNFWVGKDMELEPYMPYFGDDNEGRCKAFDLYKDMARDANQENNLSDGEVNDRGEIVEQENEQAWVQYESLPQVRWRAACREAIVQVLDNYDKNDEKVWEAMGNALGIKSRRRLRVVADIALERRKSKAENSEARRKREELRSGTVMARTFGADDNTVLPAGTMTKEAMRHFCFTCQIFHCRQHENRDVYPIVPIRDLVVEARERILAKTSAPPCSSTCFLMQAAHMAPEQENESQPWTTEELAILREVTSVFHFDPCRLATVIGTRTCRDVFAKLEEPNEKIMMKREINNSKQRRKIDSKLRSKRLADAGGRGSHDSDLEDVATPELEKGKKGKKKAFKQLENKAAPAENEDFLPCYHVGDCTIDNCTCVQRNLPCESTCACTNVRFMEGANRRGIARFIDRSARMKGENGLCQNLIYGCSCKKGHCNTDDCDCWKQNRACNPDVCEDCDCNIMPSQLPSSARRCRNVSVGIARHKRTIVGKSRVHGYGLFAADYFQPGDLIGIYGGQLLDTRLADMVGRLYDAKDHTFFFDITESTVIDGGVLGMKSKFCNHTHGGTKAENCHSKLVRVRGDANIALFAKRAIVPGEELMFDYKFQSVIPPWAKQPAKSGRKEEPMPVELEDDSPTRAPNKRKSKSRRG